MTVEASELTELDVAVYQSVLRPPGLSLEAIVRALGRSPGEVAAAVNKLSDVCLLRRDTEHRLHAVSPDAAQAQALGREELELGSRRLSVEARRTMIRQLEPQWSQGIRAGVEAGAVEIVSDPEAINGVLMHYAERCQTEVLTIWPGRLPHRVEARTRMANLFPLERGVRVRGVYQQAALRDRSTRAQLHELADHGALLRAAVAVPGRSTVIDREVALLPVSAPDATGTDLAIVREATVIAWLVAAFEQLWDESAPLADVLGPGSAGGELDQTRAAILRLLGEGEKDEAISRRLSISVRTCRRHIADYMTQVGATSRFQAGVIAARDGHLDTDVG